MSITTDFANEFLRHPADKVQAWFDDLYHCGHSRACLRFTARQMAADGSEGSNAQKVGRDLLKMLYERESAGM